MDVNFKTMWKKKDKSEQEASQNEASVPPTPKYELVDAQAWREARQAQEEIGQIREKATRLQADLENSRRRLERDKDEAVAYANASLIESLLPVIDNFELGLSATENATDAKSIAMGMKMVKVQLDKFLEEAGLETIDAVGQTFDHNLHDAVDRRETDEHPEGTILEQSRKGYKLKERLLRPASVVVATPTESKEK